MKISPPETKARKFPIIYTVTLVLSVLFIILGNRAAVGGRAVFGQTGDQPFFRAKVLSVLDPIRNDYEAAEMDFSTTVVPFKAKALSGVNRGKTVECQQQIDNMFALTIPIVQKGDTILVDAVTEEATGETTNIMYDYERTGPLLLLAFLFGLLVVLFGRKKGVDTVISLLLTMAAIFTVLIPAVMTGHNIYTWTMMVCAFIIIENLLLVQGASKKSLTAAAGCLGGVLAAGLIMLLTKGPMHITGLFDEESLYVAQLNPENPIDIKAVVFCMILIGSVGALMDVSMSIASALEEVQENSPGITRAKLMQSGFEIGKDMIGTMANTLILAYIGGSLSVIILMVAYSGNLSQIINKEMIAVEILNSLAGALSVVGAIILTSVICAMVYHRTSTKHPAA
ncbi:MAG: YibE/F family protein [Oscillospiraceae bacterium]|jgi:uncharacterized membrane protein|nr:YibE/F family protein [Oscillospiraceae bacterium]